MDRNTVTGLLLIFCIILGVSFYNSSQQKKAQEQELLEQLEESRKQKALMRRLRN